MCGIAGIVSASGGLLADHARPMIDALAHRGPDDQGLWSDGVCVLGQRRLAIIDLSAAGHQPMADARGRRQITFNGEIYNFQELRRELEAAGCVFRTRSDTEVILAAYDRWDADCVRRLRGMFAFAIWDAEARRLFLARDRVGKKPLFYAFADGRFFFASELQGLLARPEIPRDLCPEALDAYFCYGYIPAPQTAYAAIRKLPPAHTLTLDAARAEIAPEPQRYWTLTYQPKLAIDEAEAQARLRETLAEAVRLRMISDVSLGAFLSGGIDSSIVVGLMAQASGERVKTFSIGFEEAEYSELAHARRIAEKWSTEHHEFIVQADALSILPALVRHYGEPYADSSAIPTYYVAQMTRQHVTVALNGDGGDESFAGYERYLGNRIASTMNAIPGLGASAALLGRLLPDSIHPKSRLRQAHRFLAVAAAPMRDRYPRWLTFFPRDARRRLYAPDFARQFDAGEAEWLARLYDTMPALDPVDLAMCLDVNSYLPYDLLVKVDIATMMHGLEARSPFLDHEVMELAARLPSAMKLRGGRLKSLLKRTFADLLPPENVHRRKMGFGVPIGAWFRGPLRDLLRDALLAPSPYLDAVEVRRLVEEHLAARADHAFQLWNLLFFELWRREGGRER